MKRAIHLIPDLSGLSQIEAFRQRFDRLYQHIAAHITLVFPFDLPASDDVIMTHCQSSSSGIEPFTVQILSPHRSPDDHLWLPVSGSAPLRELTERLYSGPLSALAGTRRNSSYHITVARPPLPPPTECDMLQSQLIFPVTIDIAAITLEAIQPDDTSLVIGRFALRL
jgi:2'-5' RNA ligase